jgi:dipeptidyl aminopeptidase/acylaminoacyl peptidase
MGRTLLFAVVAFATVGCAGPSGPPPVEPTQPAAPLGSSCPEVTEAEGNLRLAGTPVIADALRQRLAPYLDVRQAGLSSIAEDGRSLLVATRFAQTEQAHLVRFPLGARTQLTFADEPVRSPRFLPGTGGGFLFLSDRGGDEQYQVVRAEPNGRVALVLSDGEHRHASYSISRDGARVAFNGNARNGKDMDIYLREMATGATERVLEVSGDFSPGDFSRDGKKLIVQEYVSINDARLHVLDLASKELRRVSPAEPPAAYRSAVFAASGSEIYATSDREGEHVELYVRDLASGTWRSLTRHLPWNVEEIALSPDGRTLAFVVNEHGYGVLRLIDTKSGKEQPTTAIPRGIVRSIQFADRAPVLGFTLHGPTAPGDVYSYDLTTRKLERWTESELGGMDAARFVTPELIEYESFDGRRIPAFYFRPAGAGPHPVVISIHGGPESQARPFLNPLWQYLAVESGFAVLVPNVRGSDGYGKSYLLLDNGDKREDSVRDIGALLDWIGTRDELDEKRVAVTGGSYGGYMVLASLVHFGARIAAGIDIVGISNFVTFLQNTKDYRRDLRRAEYGDERNAEMRAFLESISPSTNASKIQSALFVAHGANDPRVPLSETDQIVEAVRKNGRDVWYMVAMNEGHGFAKRDNRDLFTQLSVAFLEKHLGATATNE